MSTFLDHFSDRSRMIIFLTRMDAGKRGATALEPGHLLEAIIREDQGELAKRFVGAATPSGPIREPEPFFSEEAASNVLLRLDSILPKKEPVPHSTDMPMSSALGRILEAATTLAGELRHNQIQPLHFVAAILSDDSGELGEILKEAGISKEAVVQALESS